MCLAEFLLELFFPSCVRGPVDFRLFLRLAASIFGVIFLRIKPIIPTPGEGFHDAKPRVRAFAFSLPPWNSDAGLGGLVAAIFLDFYEIGPGRNRRHTMLNVLRCRKQTRKFGDSTKIVQKFGNKIGNTILAVFQGGSRALVFPHRTHGKKSSCRGYQHPYLYHWTPGGTADGPGSDGS